MTASAGQWRHVALARLSSRRWDLLVIGGGIIGSRIAYEAARAGLAVALVDAGDFAGATSGASSKFAHGGLRYMATRQFGLVRDAQREREILHARVAPYLVRPLPMVLVGQSGFSGPMFMAGLAAYKVVGGLRTPRPRSITQAQATQLVPPLGTSCSGSFTLLSEAQANDARLTLATVRAADEAGACVLNHARIVALERSAGHIVGAVLEDRYAGRLTLRCRAVVNAAGPWVDHVRRLEDPACSPIARLSRGAHVLLPLEDGWRAGVVGSSDGTRTSFAVPWHGMLLLGVTDTETESGPEHATATREDRAKLFANAEGLLPAELLRPERVLSAFAGLRVLPAGEGDSGLASREHVLDVGSAGMISVAGGKLTTHRLIARDAIRLLPCELRPRLRRPCDRPLPGATVPPPSYSLRSELDAHTHAYLAGLYGGDLDAVLALAHADPTVLEPIHPSGPDIWAQVHHAVLREYAVTADDIIRRRTTLGYRGLAGPAIRERISAVLERSARQTVAA